MSIQNIMLSGILLLKIGKDISDNDYRSVSKIDKNAENRYYLVKWKSDSYTFQYSNKTGRDVIKAGKLVGDAVYLNPFASFKQWYTPYKKNEGKNVFRLNTVILKYTYRDGGKMAIASIRLEVVNIMNTSISSNFGARKLPLAHGAHFLQLFLWSA